VWVNDDFKVLQSGDRFIWSSWRDGTTQLYLYSFDKANWLNSAGEGCGKQHFSPDVRFKRQKKRTRAYWLSASARMHDGVF
jgi:hypothetical protein